MFFLTKIFKYFSEQGRSSSRELKSYRHTYIQTNRPSDEAGPRGTFAPKNFKKNSNKVKPF